MDQGRIAELDDPLALWQNEAGIFRGMCDRSGIRREDIAGAKDALAALAATAATSGTTALGAASSSGAASTSGLKGKEAMP